MIACATCQLCIACCLSSVFARLCQHRCSYDGEMSLPRPMLQVRGAWFSADLLWHVTEQDFSTIRGIREPLQTAAA